MSLVSSKELEKNLYELNIFVDAETFKKAVLNNFRNRIKKITVPGFRKGKAPRSIIEKMYGRGFFFEDAIDKTYPSAIEEAEKEFGKKIVTIKKFDLDETIDEIIEDKGYSFTITVVTEPEISIEGYKGLEIETMAVDVTDEMVDEELKSVQDRNSRMVSVEDRAVKDGDTVVIDYKGTVDDIAFDGGTAENQNLVIGSNTFIPGFEDQIIGHNIDDEFDVNVTFPEEYHAEELKGKDAVFHVVLHEIKAKELPELDDDFATEVSETADTLDEYKEELRKQIQERLEKERESDIDSKVNKAVADLVKDDIPEEMVNRRAEQMFDDFGNQIQGAYGLSMDKYLEYMGQTKESLIENYKDSALNSLKLQFAYLKIAQNENLEASDEDLEEEYKKLSELYKIDVEKIKQIVKAEDLKEDVQRTKGFDFVKENAVITEKTPEEINETSDEEKEEK